MSDRMPGGPGGAEGPQPAPPGEAPVVLSAEATSAFDNADLLLGYAAESGIDVPGDAVEAITCARAEAGRGTCTRPMLVAFYAAYTKLAARLYPVTADTIRACVSPEAARSLATNRIWAIILTVVIVVLSIVTFVDTSITTKLSADILEANNAAAKLRSALKSPHALADDACMEIRTAVQRDSNSTDELVRLQQFAVGLRDIYGKAIKLNYFVLLIEKDPLVDTPMPPAVDMAKAEQASKSQVKDDQWSKDGQPTSHARLELYPALANYEAEILCKISTYEHVRSFATNILLDNSVAFGALAAYVLPIAYALLGALAFRLRTFADTVKKRTYHPSYSDSARLIAAVIAGAIVSLFNISFTQVVTLSPLALAFLIGYGVEIFFTFLDTILNSLNSGGAKNTQTPPAPR